MGGVYREIVAPERLVATELFDDPGLPAKLSTRRSWLRKAADHGDDDSALRVRGDSRCRSRVRHGARSRREPPARSTWPRSRNSDRDADLLPELK
jgi:hypothetical protein